MQIECAYGEGRKDPGSLCEAETMSDDWVVVYTPVLPEFTRKEELQKLRKKELARSKSSRSYRGRKVLAGKNSFWKEQGEVIFEQKSD